MPVIFTTRTDGAVRFAVRVHPRSARACVDGEHGDAVRVRVHAAPVDGGANADVIAVLADALEVPKRDVRIVSGDTARPPAQAHAPTQVAYDLKPPTASAA